MTACIGAYTARKAHGYSIATGEGRAHESDYLQCSHCALQFQVEPGSGKKRGYCTRCGAVTCGASKCDTCIPWRQKFDLIESGKEGMGLISTGKPMNSLPASVFFPAEKTLASGIIVAE